jgi:peptidoglycan hydrolase FlgJ
MAAIPPLPSAPAGLASDSRSLDVLRSRAALDPKGAVRAAAKQFEALFMNELMKSMRSSTLASGMLDSEGGKLGTEMLDKQYADQMTGLPGGLSDIIARQLERQMGLPAAPLPVNGTAGSNEAGTPGQTIDKTLRMQLSKP